MDILSTKYMAIYFLKRIKDEILTMVFATTIRLKNIYDLIFLWNRSVDYRWKVKTRTYLTKSKIHAKKSVSKTIIFTQFKTAHFGMNGPSTMKFFFIVQTLKIFWTTRFLKTVHFSLAGSSKLHYFIQITVCFKFMPAQFDANDRSKITCVF